jgi:NADH-quinone oxidoreductase subunit H
LVAGFHTEYSGLRWSIFFMAEYASMFAVSGAAAILFLGGWHTGLLPFEPSERWGWAGHVLNVLVFIAKGSLLVFVMMWMRWSLPRLRIDQVMMTCLKYFLPISCVLFLGVCLWELFVPDVVGKAWRIGSAVAVAGSILVLIVRLLTAPLPMPRGELPGVWAGRATPLMQARG